MLGVVVYGDDGGFAFGSVAVQRVDSGRRVNLDADSVALAEDVPDREHLDAVPFGHTGSARSGLANGYQGWYIRSSSV